MIDTSRKPPEINDEDWKWIEGLSYQNKVIALSGYQTREKEESEKEKVVEKKARRQVELQVKAKAPKIGYVAKNFVLLNLPYSKPTGDVWVRKNGNVSLIIQSGFKVNQKTGEVVEIGVPYGATARLVLFYIMSVAVISGSRKIYLGYSFDAFLKSIGATPGRRGMKTGARAVNNQLVKLINATFKILHNGETEDFNIDRIKTIPLTSNSEIWFSKKKGDRGQQGIWNSYIELSEEFFLSLKKKPIPIDWSVVLKLRTNATALDFYTLLTYESAKAQARGKSRNIPWRALMEQMGSQTKSVKKFGVKARAAILLIQKHYSSLKISFPPGELKIEKESLPSIPASASNGSN